MQIPLAEMASRATNRRRRTIVLPPIVTTAGQAANLAAIYMRVVRIWQQGARDRILPAYARTLAEMRLMRDSVDDIGVAIEATEQHAVMAQLDFARQFAAWAGEVDEYHVKRTVAQIRYATNVNLASILVAGEQQITLQQVMARNTGLVRNVSDQARGRITDIVMRGAQARTPLREVAREIANATQLARARSLRIASDQTVKLAAQLDQDRQEQLGIKKFKWRHSGKVHFRPEHRARNGKVYAWTDPVAKSDPPGRLPFCGCKAQAVLELDGD